MDRAGGYVTRAFPLQERQAWRRDEGVLVEVVYSLTWHLLRKNILTGFLKN